MRHGQTEWSLNGRHTGNTDLPLTEIGREEARTMAPQIEQHKFDLVFSSPLQRALETCQLVGLSEKVQTRDELREWDYGDYEGLTSPQIEAHDPNWLLWRDGCPGGESTEQVADRCDVIVGEVMDFVKGGGGHVIVFAHGHILRALAARWCGLPIIIGDNLMLDTAAYCQLGHNKNTPAINIWNHSTHETK